MSFIGRIGDEFVFRTVRGDIATWERGAGVEKVFDCGPLEAVSQFHIFEDELYFSFSSPSADDMLLSLDVDTLNTTEHFSIYSYVEFPENEALVFINSEMDTIAYYDGDNVTTITSFNSTEAAMMVQGERGDEKLYVELDEYGDGHHYILISDDWSFVTY